MQHVEATRGWTVLQVWKPTTPQRRTWTSAPNESNETITDKKGSCLNPKKSIAWWKRQRITEKRKSPTSRTSWPSQGCDLRNSQNQATRSAGEDPGAHQRGREGWHWVERFRSKVWQTGHNSATATGRRIPGDSAARVPSCCGDQGWGGCQEGQARCVESWQNAHQDVTCGENSFRITKRTMKFAWWPFRRGGPPEDAEQRKWLLAPHQRKWLLVQTNKRPRQRKWLMAPHQRKWPLVQVKKDPSRSGCWRRCRSCRKSRPRGRWLAEYGSAPTDPEAPPMPVGRGRNDPTEAERIAQGWCNESCVRGRGGCVCGRGRAACVDVAGIPHRRWQDQMRDKSIQCD